MNVSCVPHSADSGRHSTSRLPRGFRSAAQNCVEVAQGEEWTAARDSKNTTGRILVVTDGAWQTFIGAAKPT